MTDKTKAQKAHALVTLYVTNWQTKYGKKPQINRFRDRWGFEAMIDDLGYDRAREIISFYFRTERTGHPVDWMLYNYDNINATYEEIKRDEEKRAKIRAETARRVREWEAEHGEQ